MENLTLVKKMIDKYNREVNYLRISITDRCNLRCLYCMGEEGIKFKESSTQMKCEEILNVVKLLCEIGIKRVRITGGEPLIRKDFHHIFNEISNIAELEEVTFTTNGVLLKSELHKVSREKLRSINISLDTLNYNRYKRVTGGGELKSVLEGIQCAKELGIKVKLNAVLNKEYFKEDVLDLLEFSLKNQCILRFIEIMDIGEGNKSTGISNKEVVSLIKEKYFINEVKEEKGILGPARYIEILKNNVVGKVGFISHNSFSFCEGCNRIRVNSLGEVNTCLFGVPSYNINNNLKEGKNREEVIETVKEIIYNRQGEKSLLKEKGKGRMYEIGG